MIFTAALLKQKLALYSAVDRIWIGYSGGCDSHVLLHALASLRSEIRNEIKAVHINHGLSPLANEWEVHCKNICDDLSIPYRAIPANVKSLKTSPEAAARQARYAEWKKLISDHEVLLLAHHQDDQAETVLIQLLRGAGVKGLAAMPEEQTFYRGKLCRPLLNFSRQELRCYALEQGLNWIDDPSNVDTAFDRNFLRHDVLPVLRRRWPSLNKTLSRTASHLAEADQHLTDLAIQDWQQVHIANNIKISALMRLDEKRQRNVLRYWLSVICQLSLPATVHLQRILNEVLTAAADAKPKVIWSGGEVRRYQGVLFAQEKKASPPLNLVIPWPDLGQPLVSDVAGIEVQALDSSGNGLSQAKLRDAEITLRFRQGGEKCRPVGRGHTHRLKKLFQEWQVPPWRRSSVPLLYVNDELAEVVGYCRCEPFMADKNEPGWVLELK